VNTSINFSRDIRIFSSTFGDNMGDVVAQVAAAERLPVMGVSPGLAESKAHLLEVVAHLKGETTFQGSGLELHAASVCGRAMRLAQAFACEDLASERSGRQTILSSDQWRQVHQAVVAGCSGNVPTFRRNGTFRPPVWALDLLEMTGRLAEVGWTEAEVRIKARALGQPDAAERKAAADYASAMISRKAKWLKEWPEATEEARAWIQYNRPHLQAKARPAGALQIDKQVWVRMSPQYRTPAESAEVAEANRQRELESSNATVLIGRGGRSPFRAHREVVEILRENGRKASEYARGGRSRTMSMAR
jgi:hypothetical protein